MRATDNLNLGPKRIMTLLSESPCLIIPLLILDKQILTYYQLFDFIYWFEHRNII